MVLRSLKSRKSTLFPREYLEKRFYFAPVVLWQKEQGQKAIVLL